MNTHRADSLGERWRRVDLGVADEQERIDAAWKAGESKDASFTLRLIRLLEDESSQVRYYALQSLVLGLQQVGVEVQDLCWRLLREDPDSEVRGMAAACLGKIFLGSMSLTVFKRLVAELRSANQPGGAKSSIYEALFQVAGRPPLEWPTVKDVLAGSRNTLAASHIDWEMVAWLEAEIERADPDQVQGDL